MANIQFNCDTGQSKNVRYQCIVNGFTLGWKIDDGNSTCCCEQEYLSGDDLESPKQLSCAPDFTTTLLSNSNPLKSNISFTAMSSLIGYVIECYNASGNGPECKLQGDKPYFKCTVKYVNL